MSETCCRDGKLAVTDILIGCSDFQYVFGSEIAAHDLFIAVRWIRAVAEKQCGQPEYDTEIFGIAYIGRCEEVCVCGELSLNLASLIVEMRILGRFGRSLPASYYSWDCAPIVAY